MRARGSGGATSGAPTGAANPTSIGMSIGETDARNVGQGRDQETTEVPSRIDAGPDRLQDTVSPSESRYVSTHYRPSRVRSALSSRTAASLSQLPASRSIIVATLGYRVRQLLLRSGTSQQVFAMARRQWSAYVSSHRDCVSHNGIHRTRFPILFAPLHSRP